MAAAIQPLIANLPTLTASADTFQSILSGDLNPTSAFMSGKLAVDGDIGMAMKLGAVLS